MSGKGFDEIYRNVPNEMKDLIVGFRASHPYRSSVRQGVEWKYICSGSGDETVLLMPGGMGFCEALFRLITALERDFRVISPTYPPVEKMEDLAAGTAAILEQEKAGKVNVLGVSFGGWLAQCFVRRYRDRVRSLMLSNTSGTDGFSAPAIKAGIFSARFLPLGFLKSANKKRVLELIAPDESEKSFWEAFLEDEYSRVTRRDMLCRLLNTLDFMSNYSFKQDDLAGWQGRVLILESADDLAFQQSARDSLKAVYPGAAVITLENAGHAPSHRGSPEYISAIGRFLSGGTDG